MARSSRNKARTRATIKLLKLLRRRPLPLRALVKAIAAEPSLIRRVLNAAAAEGAFRAPDIESAVVLLGAERLRRALLQQESQPDREGHGGKRLRQRPAQSKEGELQALRKAIANDRYRVDPRDIAAAMLRDLKLAELN
jgi:hypothetical protein